jgi:hypothetical protein
MKDDNEKLDTGVADESENFSRSAINYFSSNIAGNMQVKYRR